MGDTTQATYRRPRPKRLPCKENGEVWPDQVGVWAGINPASRKAIPTHRLYCCSGFRRALARLHVCLPVYLHDETWLPSVLLQACYVLFQISHHFIKSPVPYFIYPLKYVHRCGARPQFFFVVDGAIALGNSLALLPYHVRDSLSSRSLVCG